MRAFNSSLVALALLGGSLVPLAGCGAGTAAAVGGGGGGSGSNAPPAISAFTVAAPKVSPTEIRFVLADAESNPASVDLQYQIGGAPARRLTQLSGVTGNPATLSTSSQGVEHVIQWNFAAEPDLPDNASYVPDIQVFGTVAGGIQEIQVGANAAATGLGNDAPTVTVTTPAPEVDGVVPIRIHVADSSSDSIRVRAEYDIVGDEPDTGWRIARPGGLGSGDTTPGFAFDGVVAPNNGADLVFFWDTDVDLEDLEREVRVRFTGIDPVIAGATAATATFRVDNNAEPIATVSGDLIVLNSDQRRGIPLPYTIRDEESDEVQVVFQWKHPGEDYPPLPATLVEIAALLADPVQRQLLHVCSELPTWVEGRVVPVDSTSVRLPELATSKSSILADGPMVGREIEILRASSAPAPIAATWAANPLSHPVAALPVGDGIEAVILDRPTTGAWRLRQIDLATGVVTRELVSASAGEPSAMTFERDERSVLVASDIGGAWQVARVLLADGTVTPLIDFDGSTEPGSVRDIASTGANAALITVASSLVQLDYADPLDPQAITLFDDLATPWGIALDPSSNDRVYVAEHDAPTQAEPGRIVVIDLDSRQRHPLVFGAADPLEALVSAPQSLAFDRRSDRLLVVQDAGLPDGALVRGIDVGSASAAASFAASGSLSGVVGALATGRDGLVVVALTSEDDLAVGGGLEQRRTIDGFDVAHRVAHASAEFSPALRPSQRFRIERPRVTPQATPTGARGVFLWNSADAREGGSVQFRAVPMDSERGIDGTTDGAKRVRSALDTDPAVLGGASTTNFPICVSPADVDGDGDLDLVSANFGSDTLTVFFQSSRGVFGAGPLSLGDASVTNNPVSVASADMDGDGDIDVVSANALSHTLTIFFQTSPGVFATEPLSLGDSNVTNEPMFVAAADLDRDGDLDLVSANTGSDTLTLFFQTSPGVFGVVPLVLGGPGITTDAQSVAVADLDGDGDLDLASANSGSHTVTVFFQTSAGVFGAPPLALGDSNSAIFPVSVTAADLDGDGDLDLASANGAPINSGNVTVFFQTSAGVFGPDPLTLGGEGVTGGARSVCAADLDGDGDLDLLSANQLSSTLTTFFQIHPGVFATEPLTLGDSNVTNQPMSVAPADLDGDGDLDLASANRVGHTLTVFFQSSPGRFGSLPLSLGSAGTTIRARSVAMGDLDGDGDLDIVSANSISNTFTIFLQSSPGLFAAAPLTLGNQIATAFPTSVAVGDLDGDGDLDLVSANELDLTVFFQTSPGVFGPSPMPLESAGGQATPRSVVPADLDGDGDLDLASTNPTGDTISVSFQTRPGVFATPPVLLGDSSVTDGPTCVAAADLDGDGDLDLVSTNQLGDNLAVFFQTSPGNFGPVPLLLGDTSVTDGASFVAAADLDGDGDLDLVAAGQPRDALTVFFQTSPGSFGAAPLLVGNTSTTDAPTTVAVGDIDDDGDLDLVASSNGHDTLNVFAQTSPGVFADSPLVLGGPSVTNLPFSIALGDIDGDGDVDLVSANASSNTLTVFWNGH